jgi:hypothetical protein
MVEWWSNGVMHLPLSTIAGEPVLSEAEGSIFRAPRL